MSDDLNAKIVELAIGAAGHGDRGWETRVHALIPRVASMFQPSRDDEDPNCPSVVARKVLEAHTFKAEYRGGEYDETTQRIFVKIYDPDASGDSLDDDGCQTVRTEPMWSAAGRAVREILKSMSPGQPAVFHRYTEPIEGGKKKMGVLVYVEPRKMPRDHQNAPSESGRAPIPAPSNRSSQTSSGGPPSPDDVESFEPNAALKTRFDELPPRKRVAFMHRCRNASPPIPNGLAPAEGDLDRALLFMSEIEKEET